MADAATTRAALEFVCKALDVNAEILRVAKHGGAGSSGALPALRAALLTLCVCEGESEMATVLAGLGYPRHLDLADAREMLLAFGFLQSLREGNGRSERNERKIRALRPDRYPRDLAELSGNWHVFGHVQVPAHCNGPVETSRTVGLFGPCDRGVVSERARIDTTIHRILQLEGKLRFETRRAQQLDLYRMRLLGQLQLGLGARTLGKPGKPGKRLKLPTQYELFVLERPSAMERHFEHLDTDMSAMQHLKDEELFWRWMSSVFRADRKTSVGVKPPDASDVFSFETSLQALKVWHWNSSATAAPSVDVPWSCSMGSSPKEKPTTDTDAAKASASTTVLFSSRFGGYGGYGGVASELQQHVAAVRARYTASLSSHRDQAMTRLHEAQETLRQRLQAYVLRPSKEKEERPGLWSRRTLAARCCAGNGSSMTSRNCTCRSTEIYQ
ncbi:unnamed protein product [Effrenium voratum]|nr:unnamed protein product [Effrenium voratum]